MSSFKSKEVVRILEKLGFGRKRQTGSHVIMYNPSTRKIIPVPMHNKDIRKGLMHAIIKQADSSEKEFLGLK